MNVQTYGARNEILLSMGYVDYQTYLASPLWIAIRAKAFLTHGNTCRICGKPAEVIHHTGYSRDTLEGKNLDSLAPLCNKCHLVIEFDKKGKKRTFVNAHSIYTRMIKETRRKKVKSKSCWKCGRDLNRILPTCPACRGIRKDAR